MAQPRTCCRIWRGGDSLVCAIPVPDLIILDVHHAEGDRWASQKCLRRLRAAVVITCLRSCSHCQTDRPSREGLDAGADDYVHKPVCFPRAVGADSGAAQLKQPSGVSVSNRLRFQESHFGCRSLPASNVVSVPIQLTSLEFKVLQEFLEQPERVMNKQKLLDRVWGLDFYGDENVVEVYVKQLRQKLEAEGEARLIHTIRNVGYVLRDA